MMRTMNILRRAKDLKSRGLQSRMYTGGQNAQQPDEIRIQDIISISNHGFCAKREKYTKDIREELDPRDKECTFPFQTTFNVTQYLLQKAVTLSQNLTNQQSNKNKEQKKSQQYLKLRRIVFNYISEVCQNVSSVAFRLLSKGELTDGQAKAFAAKIILSNIQSVLMDMNSKLQQYTEGKEKPQLERQLEDLMKELTKAIDEELSQIFSELAGHYPQAPPAGATANMREVTVDVNRAQDEQNNLIFSSDIKISQYATFNLANHSFIKLREDYTGFVMEVINQAIEITRTIVDQDLTLFQKFQQFTEILFALANTDKKSQKLSSEDKNRLSKLTNSQRINIFYNLLQSKKPKQQPQTQSQKYQQRQLQSSLQFQQRIVEQYKRNNKVLTAQKIPSHVKPFSHADIKQGNFKVNHSSVLRIMTKWVESLQALFEKPEQEIGERFFKFKDLKNKIIDQEIDKQGYQEIIKKELIKNLKAQYESVKVQLNNLKEENSLFQSYILSEKQSESSCLKRFSKVRESSAQINAIAIEYTKKYLCILIDHLLKAGSYFFRDFRWNLLINLLTFRVGDLLRSKLQCSERSFINLMKILNQLDNSKEMQGKFKLVRIKNKLNMRDNNVLINYMFMGKVQCELQLSVHRMDDRDKHYYDFCHFLYELTRGKLGVLTECATVVCQHDSIINSSTDAYYRPKCYEQLQRKKRIHMIHEKNKDIYQCINCGQLKMGENTSLFEQESLCNICIVKQDKPQQKLKHKNDILQKEKRIKNYGQIEDGDYIILVNNRKTGKLFKLYKAWKPQQQLKLFLVQINEQVLKEFQKQNFQYAKINYFNILNKMKKKQEFKELTYNLGNKITAQILKITNIKSQFLLKIQPFFEANRSYRIEKNLIKLIQFKSQFIVANENIFKWSILQNVISAYSSGIIEQLRYKKYKTLDWSHIRSIGLRRNELTRAKQMIKLAENCSHLELEQNKLTQVNLEKLSKLQYLSIWENQISSVDFKANPLLTTLHMGENILQTINLKFNIKLTTLNLYNNKLKEVDLSSNINLEMLSLNDNQIQQIDLSSNIEIKYLQLSNNKLKKINLSSNIRLKQIAISQNQLQQIDLSSLTTSLEYLDLHNNKLKKFHLASKSHLMTINLSNNLFQEIDLSPAFLLMQLNLEQNKLKKIDLNSNFNISQICLRSNQLQQISLNPKMHNYSFLELGNNKFKEIDLGMYQNLVQLYIYNNPLEHINLQNNHKLSKVFLPSNKLSSVRLWISELRDIEQLLDDQQSKQCKVILLYRKVDYEKFGEILEQLVEKYKLGSTFNKYNCQYIFQGEERN